MWLEASLWQEEALSRESDRRCCRSSVAQITTLDFSLFFSFFHFFSFLPHFWIQWFFFPMKSQFFRQLVKYFLEDMFCFLRIIGNFKALVFQYWRSHPCICGRQKLWFITLGFWKSVSLRLTFFSYYYLRHVSNIIHRLISKSAFFKASETTLSKCTSLKQMNYRQRHSQRKNIFNTNNCLNKIMWINFIVYIILYIKWTFSEFCKSVNHNLILIKLQMY